MGGAEGATALWPPSPAAAEPARRPRSEPAPGETGSGGSGASPRRRHRRDRRPGMAPGSDPLPLPAAVWGGLEKRDRPPGRGENSRTPQNIPKQTCPPKKDMSLPRGCSEPIENPPQIPGPPCPGPLPRWLHSHPKNRAEQRGRRRGGRGGGRGCSGAPRDPPSDLSPHAGIAAPSPAVPPQLFGASVGFRAPPGTARGHFWAEPLVERSFPRESLFPGPGGGSAARNGRLEMFFPPIPLFPRISCEAFGSLRSARCVLWGEEDEECLPPIPAVLHSHSSSSPQEHHKSMTRLSKVPSMTGEQSPPGSPNPLSPNPLSQIRGPQINSCPHWQGLH